MTQQLSARNTWWDELTADEQYDRVSALITLGRTSREILRELGIEDKQRVAEIRREYTRRARKARAAAVFGRCQWPVLKSEGTTKIACFAASPGELTCTEHATLRRNLRMCGLR